MWFIFALAVSWFNALYYVGNQNSRFSPMVFMVYRGFLPSLFVLPLLFFMPHDFAWPFYLIVILQGLAISFVDLRYFHAFKKFGAETVCSIRPLAVILTFCLWIALKPNMLMQYAASPVRSFLIVLSIIAIVYAVIKYRQHPVGLNCLAQVFPLLFISAIIDTSNKVVMEYANSHLLSASLWRVFITGIIIGGINLSVSLQHNIKLQDIFAYHNLRKSLFILFLVLSMITVNFSLYYADNPAYTSAIIYLSVIWVMLINKLRIIMGYPKKVYESIDKKWIFILLIAATILILATN